MNKSEHQTAIRKTLYNSWIFRDFSQKEKEMLIQNSNLVNYSGKDLLFRQHTRTSHVMYAVSGLVKVFKDNGADRIISLKIVSKDHFVGLDTLYGESVYQYSAAAIKKSCTLIIPF